LNLRDKIALFEEELRVVWDRIKGNFADGGVL